MKKILLGLIAIIFANSVNASDYAEKNAVNQISEYFNKTDLSNDF